MPTALKTQRWVDLLAALLTRRYPAPFETLAKDVPAYQSPKQKDDARMRMFERDKDELRKAGVPIETVEMDSGEKQYQLRSRDFYLPVLGVSRPAASRAVAGRPAAVPAAPARVSRPPELVFEPEELVMIARAAGRVQAMQHPVLSADANAAMRKLAFDVPFVDRGPRELILLPFTADDPLVLDRLDDALRRRKFVQFDYHSMEEDLHSRRKVAPYGLVFLGGHWYLWAHDQDKKALRQFRVSRITKAAVNSKNAQKADFTVPADFDLWERSKSRQAWELSDDDAVNVEVAFDLTDGHAAAGALLGKGVRGEANVRRFIVRRAEPFVRWLLSFGGAARPVSPAWLAKQWRTQARKTSALYAASREEKR